ARREEQQHVLHDLRARRCRHLGVARRLLQQQPVDEREKAGKRELDEDAATLGHLLLGELLPLELVPVQLLGLFAHERAPLHRHPGWAWWHERRLQQALQARTPAGEEDLRMEAARRRWRCGHAVTFEL